MFPKVTGSRFLTTTSITETSAPANHPCQKKNMLAIECSNPKVTNILIGRNIPSTLPGRLFAELANQSARQTSQFPRIPLRNMGKKADATFEVAIEQAPCVATTEPMVPAAHVMQATKAVPTRLPR
mmetsp:Transcript_7128/g.44172  ORF Transcript_7128/g.44172 Transcript_7128/m.44172 type:complete len:126 (-) Transcript_7128:624-1001(-)